MKRLLLVIVGVALVAWLVGELVHDAPAEPAMPATRPAGDAAGDGGDAVAHAALEHPRLATASDAVARPRAPTDVAGAGRRTSDVLCAGMVVDRNGVGIAEATVRLLRPGEMLDGSGAEADDGQPMPSAISSAGGAFAIHGRTRASALRVVATHLRWSASDIVACAVGQTDLRLVVIDPGKIVGNVAVDTGIPMDLVRVVAVKGDPPTGPPSARDAPEQEALLHFSGVFTFESPDDGDYTIIVSTAGISAPLLVVTRVPLIRGTTTHDARLDAVDLRGRLRLVTLTCVDEARRPVPLPVAALVSPGAPIEKAAAGVKRPPGIGLLIEKSASATDFVVSAAGFRDTPVLGVTASTEVTVRRPLRVRLQLGWVPRTLPRLAFVQATLFRLRTPPSGSGAPLPVVRDVFRDAHRVSRTFLDDIDRLAPQVVADIGDDLTGLALCPAPGRYAVHLMLMKNRVEAGKRLADREPIFIDVADMDTDQRVDLPAPTREAIDAALR